MHYSLIRKSLILAGINWAAWGCSTVPQDAPQEFQTAKAALDRADKADVDKVLPATISRVNQEFSESLQLYKKSRDQDIKEPERDNLLKSSKDKAVSVQALTEEALTLQEQIKGWDGHIENYSRLVQDNQIQAEQVKQLQAQLEAAASASRQNLEVSTSPDIMIKGPVAYFGPSQTQVDPRFRESIGSIAQTLTTAPHTKVTLSGFSDSRGEKSLNDKLAKKRAENVANILKEKGVNSDQIVIETWPAVSKKGPTNRTEAEMQLDRRVEAYISNNTTDGPSKEKAR